MSEFSKAAVVTMGIDLAKRSFHLFGVDASGKPVLSKKLTRGRLSAFMANLPACTVAMEACGSAHHWARQFRRFGHEVRLIAPQFVKPFVKSNKNDAADAEAICEAAQRPNMRFVAVKTIERRISRRCIACAASPWSGAPRRSTKCAVCCWNTASRFPRGARR
jgi:transposase